MNATETTPRPGWSRVKWLLVVVVIFVAQFALIWGLGSHQKPAARRPFPAPPALLVGDSALPLVELGDPTILALPHARGFSGQAWARTPRREFVSADWDEPFRWRPVAVERLGEVFQQLVAGARVTPVQVAEKSEPAISLLETSLAAAVGQRSSLVVEGELATRDLAVAPRLPSWPATEILAATEVRVLVDADGRVVSAGLLPVNGSGKAEQGRADQEALELARMMQFASIRPATGLASGKLIFQWHTLAPVVAETPSTRP